jgi:NADP-dependent 3-hydroxy acid dehydrogenase YdfG
MTMESIDTIVDTNLKAPLFWMKAVIPLMVNQSSGTIVNISSVAGKTAFPYWSVYCATKFGLTAATESVKEEQRHNGIRVVAIHPGAVNTPLWTLIEPGLSLNRNNMLSPDDVAQAVLFALDQPDHVLVEDIQLTPLKPAL